MGSSVTPALIICGVIGVVFLLLALVLIIASLSAREKKEKVVEVQQQTGFFATATEDRSKIRAASRTNARQAAQYADLADLPGENASRGVQELNRPLSHTELLGQLGDDEEDRT